VGGHCKLLDSLRSVCVLFPYIYVSHYRILSFFLFSLSVLYLVLRLSLNQLLVKEYILIAPNGILSFFI
jgi:hypothetical protein